MHLDGSSDLAFALGLGLGFGDCTGESLIMCLGDCMGELYATGVTGVALSGGPWAHLGMNGGADALRSDLISMRCCCEQRKQRHMDQ